MNTDELKLATLDDAQEGFYILNKVGKIIYVNKSGMEMFGFEKEEKVGKFIFDFIEDTLNRLRAIEYIPKILLGHKIKDEMKLTKKNGEVIYVMLSAGPVYDKSQNIEAIYVFLIDITEKKKTEEELGVIQEGYKEVLENGIDGIVVLDEEGKFVWVNKSTLKMFEVNNLEELIDKTIFNFIDPVSANDVIGDFKLVMSGVQEGFLKEYVTVSSSGKKYRVESVGRKTVFMGKNVDWITFRDITERKKTEERFELEREEIKKINKLMVGRELKMIELKEKIKGLEEQLQKKQ